MSKNWFNFIAIIYFFLFIPSSFAARLHWNHVESTENCVIAGYKVHYGTISGDYSQVVNVGAATAYNLDLLGLVPTQTYFFAVNAYSTTNQEGPLSSPVSYTDSPNIVPYPFVDHGNNIIDITFNESNMLGADVKDNYEFSPTILFNSAHKIVRTDRTYRLFMQYIPEYTILTMRVSDITDNKGHALISDSIVLNDDDNDSMADDWESHYGIRSAFSDSDSDGLYNLLEYTIGTNPVDYDSDDDGMIDGWEVFYNLNPHVNDAKGDIDRDGINNLDEYYTIFSTKIFLEFDGDGDGDVDGTDLVKLADDGNLFGLLYFAREFGKQSCLRPYADLDGDGDVDGTDLVKFAGNPNLFSLHSFAREFGKQSSPRLYADLDEDGDVDGTDLVKFAGDPDLSLSILAMEFGKTN